MPEKRLPGRKNSCRKSGNREILSQKRTFAFNRNGICQDYCSEELARADWNKDYVDYLQSQFINANDVGGFTEEELMEPVMTREEFERQQALELYCEKASRAGELWDIVLNQLSGSTHKWKWDYMDYLEGIKYKDTTDVTLEDAKQEIMSYEEFTDLMQAEKGKQQQAAEMVANPAVATDIAQDVAVSEEAEPEIVETEEVVSEVVADIPKVIDYSKLAMEERAEILPVPTDDYEAEYDAYCQRMGYTAEKMKSIRYKMTVYDEFLEEYQYRKKHYSVREDSGMIVVSEKSRGAR